jgi:GNAT superfamily N-acetyltransferase
VQAPEFLMSRALHVGPALPPEGHTLTLRLQGAATDADIHAAEGQLAAGGRMAQAGGFVVFDQIVTEPAHRRKGLGGLVMRALGNQAVNNAAHTGVLVATEDGRALYSRLGWTVLSEVTAAVLAA